MYINIGLPVKPHFKNKEEENLVNSLYEENSKLKSQVANLSEKNKALIEQLERKKREIAMVKKQKPMVQKVVVERPSSAPGGVEIMPAKTNPEDMLSAHKGPAAEANLLAIARNLNQR